MLHPLTTSGGMVCTLVALIFSLLVHQATGLLGYVKSAPGESECPEGSTEITDQFECLIAIEALGYTLNDNNMYIGETCNFPNGCSAMATWNSDGTLAPWSRHFISHYGTSGVMPHFSPPSKSCGSGRNDMIRICMGAVDCEMDAWTAWWQCSAECGSGTQQRFRTVKVAPTTDGMQCDELADGGHESETQDCNTHACPTPSPTARDCEMDAWTAWWDCSAECDGGTQSRIRTVKVAPTTDGMQCDELADGGHELETQYCNTHACPRCKTENISCEGHPFRRVDTADCGEGPCDPEKCCIGEVEAWIERPAPDTSSKPCVVPECDARYVPVSADQKAGVRCCTKEDKSEDESFVQNDGCEVYHNSYMGPTPQQFTNANSFMGPGDENGVVHEGCEQNGGATFAEAEQKCAQENLRLCTEDEVKNQCAHSSGCGINSMPMWTSRRNLEAYVIQGKPGGPNCDPDLDDPNNTGDCSSRFEAADKHFGLICCADPMNAEEEKAWEDAGYTQSDCVYKVWRKAYFGPKNSDADITGCTMNGGVTYDYGKTFCSDKGARLCTKTEVENRCVQMPGCKTNWMPVWTSHVRAGEA